MVTIELARDKGWGAHVMIRVADTAAAQEAALAFISRVAQYTPGENYHVPAIIEDETDGPLSQVLEDYFFPRCEHGLSAQLCAGPGHYPRGYPFD